MGKDAKQKRFYILYGIFVFCFIGMGYFYMLALRRDVQDYNFARKARTDQSVVGQETVLRGLMMRNPDFHSKIDDQLTITTIRFNALITVPEGGYANAKYFGIYGTVLWMNILTIAVMLATSLWLMTLLCRGAIRKSYFDRKTVILTRALGFMLIAFYILDTQKNVYHLKMLGDFFIGKGVEIGGQIFVGAFQILTLIFIFVFAEMMRIGNMVNEENKMTI